MKNFTKKITLHDNKNSALLGKSPAQKKSKLFNSRGKPKNGWSEANKGNFSVINYRKLKK